MLKAVYRWELGNIRLLDEYTETTPYNKNRFLSCYSTARKAALDSRTARSGWSATGLWPVNISKPLLSRQLIENTNKVPETPATGLQKVAEDTSFKWPGAVALATPHKSGDLCA